MITIFEKYKTKKTIGKFWKFRADSPYLEISLKKINPGRDFSFLTDRIEKKHVILGNWYRKNDSVSGWEYDDIDNFDDYIDDVAHGRLEYMGEPEVTEEDIEQWNLEQDSKKYNL